MEEFITYLSKSAGEARAEAAALLKDGRGDDADFMKVRANIYDVCLTVSRALLNRPGAGTGAIGAQLTRFRAEWGAALETAKRYGDVRKIAVEEIKLAALEDVIARFGEVAGA